MRTTSPLSSPRTHDTQQAEETIQPNEMEPKLQRSRGRKHNPEGHMSRLANLDSVSTPQTISLNRARGGRFIDTSPSSPVPTIAHTRDMPLSFGTTGSPASSQKINKQPSGPNISLGTELGHSSIHDLSQENLIMLSTALGLKDDLPAKADRSMHEKAITGLFRRIDTEALSPVGEPRNIAALPLVKSFSAEQQTRLIDLAQICHLGIKQQGDSLQLYFGGIENLTPETAERDLKQTGSTAFGKVGTIYHAVEELAHLIAPVLKSREYQIDLVCGHSMGGGTAQAFVASISNQVFQPKPVSMILLDPQLLNNAQARNATKSGNLGYSYSAPRGVAITLNYADNPRKGLMEKMKSLQFNSPGLLQLKLELSAYDGKTYHQDGSTETREPEPFDMKIPLIGNVSLGYHHDMDLFNNAIARMLRKVTMTFRS